MKAVILCGGMGTRLREHTEFRPKPMVEVGGIPLLVHILRSYAKHGIDEFVLCLGYKGEQIKRYFLDYEAMQSDFTVELGKPNALTFHDRRDTAPSWKVTLAETGASAMTGARLRKAARYLDGQTFALTYGDGVSDVDLGRALAFHRGHGGKATMTGVRPPSRFGEIEHDGGRVRVFNEKPNVGTGLINGGFFFFEPSFLDYLDTSDDCILEKQPLERCVADGALHVFEHDGFWQCMDTYRDWEHLEALWNSGKAPWR